MKNSIQFFNLQFHFKSHLLILLTKIFGISLFLANQICKNFGFTKNSFLKDVPLLILNKIRKFILTKYTIQNKLKSKIYSNIQLLIKNKSIIGFRHKLKLPVRGQRTHTNHKTQKNYVNKYSKL